MRAVINADEPGFDKRGDSVRIDRDLAQGAGEEDEGAAMPRTGTK
jgi:hypothetical protein